MFTPNDKIDAILEVTKPDGSHSTVLTDDLGFYDFGNVAPGKYTISPRYFPSVSKTLEVVAGQSSTGDLVIPQAGIGFYVFNSSKAPLDSETVRKALVASISRTAIKTQAGLANTIAVSLVPPSMAGPWASTARIQVESLATAKSLLGSTPVNVSILHNVSNQHAAVAAEVKAEWQAISPSVSVTIEPQVWDVFVDRMNVQKDFQVARNGWLLDSNNLMSLYDYLGSFVTTAEFTTLRATAWADLKALKMAAYERDLNDLNNYIVDHAYAQILYSY